ncbi:MAG: thiamine biosynthesis protein ThiJ [Rhodospirillaceae bacterium]|nr:MAG: thiamine biosynthesis protein ThiJ [Rhodospirillaceae bacterium]
MTKTVGIFVFDDIEVLDLGGPFEVFSVANRVVTRSGKETPFNVITISSGAEQITARGNYQFVPSHTFANAPFVDILIVPGGVVDQECKKTDVVNWIAKTNEKTELSASVCTGAFLLAEAGLLNGLNVTTHWEDCDDLEHHYPELTVVRNQPWVDEGNIVTSAGISAGISMSLHLVQRLINKETAITVARQMEYDWQAD